MPTRADDELPLFCQRAAGLRRALDLPAVGALRGH